MADIADRAEEREAEIRADALAAHQRRMQATGPSLSNCERCGNDIPELRRLALPGVHLCVHCQARNERHQR